MLLKLQISTRSNSTLAAFSLLTMPDVVALPLRLSLHFRELRDYFNNSYDLNESLFTCLKGNHLTICIDIITPWHSVIMI